MSQVKEIAAWLRSQGNARPSEGFIERQKLTEREIECTQSALLASADEVEKKWGGLAPRPADGWQTARNAALDEAAAIVKANQRYEASDFPVCNSIAREILALKSPPSTPEPGK
jgi:hypothetical protein